MRFRILPSERKPTSLRDCTSDNWKTPIVINLEFPQANLPDVPSRALYFSQTGSDYLKAVEEQRDVRRRRDALSVYLDSFELQVQD